MNRRNAHWQHYDRAAGGILVPSGYTADFRSFGRTTVFATKIDSINLLNLFRKYGFNPDRSPTLISLVRDTAFVSDSILMGKNEDACELHLFKALQLRRIVDAVDQVLQEPALPRVLEELLDGTVDLLQRSQSKAKDTLWELELLSTLRNNQIHTILSEPDLIAFPASNPIGIACKKIYSEANFHKRIQSAVRQIERYGTCGLIAVNIDDLTPQDKILKTDTADQAAGFLRNFITGFMHAHEHTLRRYIEPGRAIAVLVSCAALSDIKDNEPRFCNYRQNFVWHIPNVSDALNEQFSRILHAFQLI